MMQHIEHGKIVLEESGGKLHMRISEEDTEYLRARPKVVAPVAPRVSDDIPTGPQVFGEAPLDAGPMTSIAEEAIAPEPAIIEEKPEPLIDAADTISRQPVEGILSPSNVIPRPSAEVFVDDQFGLDSEEYGAIKGVTVEKLLKQIPSRDEGWAIWRGEVSGKEITLPHDGIYGAMEFKKHLDLAEHIRGLKPDDTAMKADVDTFMKNEIRSKWPNVTEAPAHAEQPVIPSAVEAQPVPSVNTADDIPTGPQVFGEELVVSETPIVPPVAEEANVPAPWPSAAEGTFAPQGITPEKFMLLNEDIYNSKVPVQKIITQYRVGNITPDDFANYYSEKVANAKPSSQMLENMKKTFSDAAGEGLPRDRANAQTAIKVMVQRMQGIK